MGTLLKGFLFCVMQEISITELYKLFELCNQTVCTDTRKIIKGSLFFALSGSNYNANEFAQFALENGCQYAIVTEPSHFEDKRIIRVQDTLKTLQQLANYHRKKFHLPVLAITGSNGKTTHKELINVVLSKKFKTLATFGNLNNHIGVPLTLLNIRQEHEFAIIEMGANHKGEIAELCSIAEPNFGLITNIGKAHLEGFGGIEGVKIGKSELYKHLAKGSGKVFLNSDDEVLKELAHNNAIISYGSNRQADVIGQLQASSENVKFKYAASANQLNWDAKPVIHTNIVGAYNYINCLAAVCIGHYFGLDEMQIKTALEEYVPNMNRSQMVDTGKNKVILDAYNANPSSMKAAIENFADYPAQQKLLLLGDMFELGDYSKEEHQKIINLLKQHQLLNTILVGEEFLNIGDNTFKAFKTTEECKNYLKTLTITKYSILIKGSRGMKMEVLQDLF